MDSSKANSIPDLPIHPVRAFRDLAKVAEVRPALVLASLVTILLSSLFQMFGLGLVIPVLNGLIDATHFESLRHASFVGWVIRQMPFEATNKNIFFLMMVLIASSVYLENIFVFLGRTISARIATDTVYQCRVKIFERLLTFGRAFYDRYNPAIMNTLITTIVSGCGQAIQLLTQLIIVFFFSLTFLTIMVVISWKLTLFAAVLLPCTHFVSQKIAKHIKHSAGVQVSGTLKLSDHALDILRSVTLTQLSGAEKKEQKIFSKWSGVVRDAGYNIEKKRYAVPAFVDIINSTGVVLIVAGSVFLFISENSYSLGRLLVYFVSLRRLTGHLQQASDVVSQLAARIPYVRQVLWIFSDDQKVIISGGDRPFSSVEKAITFEGVSFAYDRGTPVLKDIHLRVEAGKALAIVGSTGSGKSTLVNLLARLYDLQHGSIYIDGVDIRELDIRQYRRRIAYVSQESMILNCTIEENLLLGLPEETVSRDDVWAALRAAQLDRFVSELPDGLETSVGPDGTKLSGGERQRLAIARAILRDATIVVLDEATSALDAETEMALQKAIEYIMKDRTVFVIAHRLATVRHADQLIVLEAGRIVEQGDPEVLIQSGGRFSDYCQLQNLQ